MANKKLELDLQRVEQLAGLGLNYGEIASCLGVSRLTIARRRKDSEQFDTAIKNGQAKACSIVANKLFELVEQGNLGAIVWYEKTRCGRTDRSVTEMVGKNDKPIEVVVGFDMEKAAGKK
jgi:hypothetical protein